MPFSRSRLCELTQPAAFEWMAGIEDTFITASSPKTGRTLDEYELTGHYERWSDDIGLFAALGLRSVRYGVPWHRIQPARDRWDWEWTDRAIDRLLELGISPVVDLVHYGLPGWIEGAWLHPRLDDYMAEYAAKTAERYRGRVQAYTPLNEPRITAWYCGKLGWWPPARQGWRGFLAVLLAVCRGIVRASRAIEQADADAALLHVDATDLYEGETADLRDEAARRQELVFLALDLVTGRVRAGHPLHAWMLQTGVRGKDLEWFESNAIALDLLGINLYPMFSEKLLFRRGGKLRMRMPYAKAGIVDRLVTLYWQRYRCPLLISETASVGAVAKRLAWLRDSVEAVRRVRAAGLPLVGYTWWPLFALVTWGYREGNKAPSEYLRQMGLYDLRPTERGLLRVSTPLVERYRGLVAGGSAAAGLLAPGASRSASCEGR